MREVLIRAARTFIQTFAGALGTMEVVMDESFIVKVGTAAVAAFIAALLAVGANLPSAEYLAGSLGRNLTGKPQDGAQDDDGNGQD